MRLCTGRRATSTTSTLWLRITDNSKSVRITARRISEKPRRVDRRRLARLEGRVLDADAPVRAGDLFSQLVTMASVHNEAIAYERAARFYRARAGSRPVRGCLPAPCALRLSALGGADGKVRQLDEQFFSYRHLRQEQDAASYTATIGTPVEQLHVETVVRASQALSERNSAAHAHRDAHAWLTVEHAGAERGLLILLRDDEPQIEAEAITSHGRAAVTVWRTAVTPFDLPQSALHYVIRTRERVLLDDASVENLYSQDEYLRRKHPRSVLCVPIVKQSKLVGVLYLENNLTPRAFTLERVAVLELVIRKQRYRWRMLAFIPICNVAKLSWLKDRV